MVDPLPQPGSLIGERYRIEALLGRGGMGAVFAAVDERTGRAVAIKWMLPRAQGSEEAYARFIGEARAMARIEHPNVIAVLDVGREDGFPFLVMERLRGESLEQRIEGTRLSVAEALDVVIAACRGVAEAHREQVIHRDLKPDNIFLCESKDGRPRTPKVLDFGVAKLLGREGAEGITKSGAALGTPSYMAPEQIGSSRDVDARVDVYAMGVVLYRALSGRLPYESVNVYELILHITQGNAAPLRALAPDVPPSLEAVVRRAMSVEREHRQPSMRALIDELEAISTELGAGPAIQAPLVMPRGGTAPMTAAPPLTRSVRSTRAPARAAAPPERGPAVALALIGAAALLGLAGMVIAAAHWLRQADDRGGEPAGATEGAGAGGVDPLRPRIELRFGGECPARFEAQLAVTTTAPLLAITEIADGRQVGALIIEPYRGEPRGTIPLAHYGFLARPTVTVEVRGGSEERWVSWGPRTDPGDPASPVSGALTFHHYAPERGVMDVIFEDVVLVNERTGRLCHVDGRVQTFGLTWGGT